MSEIDKQYVLLQTMHNLSPIEHQITQEEIGNPLFGVASTKKEAEARLEARCREEITRLRDIYFPGQRVAVYDNFTSFKVYILE